MGDFLRAGSVALGVGSSLVNNETVKAGDMGAITRRAQEFVRAVKVARAK